MRATWMLLAFAALAPAAAFGQSAGEVERCFQNPAACSQGGDGAAAAPAPAPSAVRPSRRRGDRARAGLHDGAEQSRAGSQAHPGIAAHARQVQRPDRRQPAVGGDGEGDQRLAEGPWLRAAGKLTPNEAQQLNNEASRTPIKRIDPPTTTAARAGAASAPPSNADALKALKARLAERRKAAEPKANAATEALVKDLKAYVAADGKGAAGEQFAAFAKWYADNKSAGRMVGDIKPAVDDYGDAKAGAAATAEVLLETKQDDSSQSECLVFAWIEGNPRKDTQAFSCDDVAAVEKWKTDQALKSAWR